MPDEDTQRRAYMVALVLLAIAIIVLALRLNGVWR
jgi:hypothetical protein